MSPRDASRRGTKGNAIRDDDSRPHGHFLPAWTGLDSKTATSVAGIGGRPMGIPPKREGTTPYLVMGGKSYPSPRNRVIGRVDDRASPLVVRMGVGCEEDEAVSAGIPLPLGVQPFGFSDS
jgi:hypothetical protein